MINKLSSFAKEGLFHQIALVSVKPSSDDDNYHVM